MFTLKLPSNKYFLKEAQIRLFIKEAGFSENDLKYLYGDHFVIVQVPKMSDSDFQFVKNVTSTLFKTLQDQFSSRKYVSTTYESQFHDIVKNFLIENGIIETKNEYFVVVNLDKLTKDLLDGTALSESESEERLTFNGRYKHYHTFSGHYLVLYLDSAPSSFLPF